MDNFTRLRGLIQIAFREIVEDYRQLWWSLRYPTRQPPALRALRPVIACVFISAVWIALFGPL